MTRNSVDSGKREREKEIEDTKNVRLTVDISTEISELYYSNWL